MLPRIDKPTKGKSRVFEAPAGSELRAACAIDLEQHGTGGERRHWLVNTVEATLLSPTSPPTFSLSRSLILTLALTRASASTATPSPLPPHPHLPTPTPNPDPEPEP